MGSITEKCNVQNFLIRDNISFVGFQTKVMSVAHGHGRFITVFHKSFKGGSEPLRNEMKGILGSKLEDRHPFFDLVQNTFVFLTCFFCNFLKALRDMRKFLQKCQRIAMCQECAFNGS